MRVLRPFSIVQRLTILVVAVSLVMLCLNTYLFLRSTRPLVGELAGSLARSILVIRAALQQVPAGQRDALSKALRFGGFPVFRDAAAPAYDPALPPFDLLPLLGPAPPGSPAGPGMGPPPPPWMWSGRSAAPAGMAWPSGTPALESPPERRDWAEQLRSRLDFPITLLWLRPAMPGPPLLRVRFFIDREDWVVDLPGGGRPPMGPLALALMLLAGAGLAAAVATVAGVRWVTRPMARLADQVAARQRELRPTVTSLAPASVRAARQGLRAGRVRLN